MKNILKIIIISTIIISTISIFIYNYHNKKEKTIYEKNDKIQLNIKYPKYKYKKVNNVLNKIISSYLKDKSSYYFLNIDYKEYTYNNYISIVLFISYFKGGAHPTYEIKTINYNKSTNKFINIDNLINGNKDILNKLSIYSREYFSNNTMFKDKVISNMMQDGTKAIKSNYSLFSLSPDGLIIYFKRYQIAPYYYGDYSITIPYNYLNLSI